jgi:hypothetical protein
MSRVHDEGRCEMFLRIARWVPASGIAAFPAWLAWLSVLAAVAGLFGIVFFPPLVVLAWIAGLSAWLFVQAGRPAPAAAPTPA